MKKEHWENVFAQKQMQEVSWYQSFPRISIDFFEGHSIPKEAKIIDVGSGDSYFIDYLLDNGYENIYALDISENALQRLKKRLGGKAEKVNFIVSDILDLNIDVQFDYWHDRAAFHFLANNADIDKYIALTNSYVKNAGKMMLATFSDSGPLKCSGLNVQHYSQEGLAKQFSNYFNKIKCIEDVHITPFNTTQNFTYCSFNKK